ncbi:hypothetical protein OG896_24995 [Streptomyces sp. NBC_00669]|uniref:hypothetical protein n=1 Tax=Streptomyces sp. NBC_00669 TaxID=2976011 RepID=UPI002E305538|nr:hypothetical protein [Streptomyces sp. NBC_00669]
MTTNDEQAVRVLQEQITAWSRRCRASEDELRTVRIRSEEAEAARADVPERELFVATYEDELALFATSEAAREWCDDLTRPAVGPRDWAPWVDDRQQQVWTCPDTDRPTGTAPGLIVRVVTRLGCAS